MRPNQLTRTLCSIAFGLAILALPPVLRADAGVETRAIFLVGHTTTGTGDERLLLPADGVVPLSAETRRVTGAPETGLALEALVESLQKTMRLTRISTRGWGTSQLGIGASSNINLTNPGGLRANIQLTALDQSLATFRVQLQLQNQILADTSIEVPFGQRAVVGAMDGPSAPYVFLVIEALGPATAPIAASSGTPPTPLEEVRAPYTEPAKEVRIQGVVILQVEVDASGRVVSTKVLKGLPFGLDREAQRAVEATPFAPATDAAGTPIAATVNLTINFRMPD